MESVRLRVEGGGDWVEFDFRGQVDESDPALAGWIWVWIRAHVDCFEASIPARFFVREIAQFRTGLKALDESLAGVARLDSTEGWATLEVTVEANGSLRIVGSLGSPDRRDVRLTYSLTSFDQTYLAGWITTLGEVDGVSSS